jgi:alanine-synthesizing transaminase
MDRSFPRLSGLPAYVLAQVDEAKSRLRALGEDVFDFGLGNPDRASPPAVVRRLIETAEPAAHHRYAPSHGIAPLRAAICAWYARRHGVTLDPEVEAVATLGSKEGLAHLFMALLGPGDIALVPDPCYPIHRFGPLFAGADLALVPTGPGRDPVAEYDAAWQRASQVRTPKVAVVNFPHNPTTATATRAQLEALVRWAERRDLWLISDLAYADLVFDGEATSLLSIAGAHDRSCEFFTVSKSYNMPGWRVGFCVGNKELVGGLKRFKGYVDYGHFTPVQLAAATALTAECDAAVAEVRDVYRHRRDALVEGLAAAGWKIPTAEATMFVWAPLPAGMTNSVEFSMRLLEQARVAVAPGIGFGPGGEGFVRFALVEEVERTREACRRIAAALQK